MNELPAALKTMTGADVQWLTNPPSVVVRGTDAQVVATIAAIKQLERDAEQSAAAMAAASAQADAAAGATLFDIDFPGGTLTDYFALIRKAPNAANVIVLSEELKTMPVPPIRAERVSVDAAIQLVASLPLAKQDEDFRLRLNPSNPTQPGEQRIWVLSIDRPARQARPARPLPAVSTGLYDLSLFKERPEAVAALLEAIGVGIELGNSEGRERTFAMKLHERSGLLFARGTMEELAMVENVISLMAQPD